MSKMQDATKEDIDSDFWAVSHQSQSFHLPKRHIKIQMLSYTEISTQKIHHNYALITTPSFSYRTSPFMCFVTFNGNVVSVIDNPYLASEEAKHTLSPFHCDFQEFTQRLQTLQIYNLRTLIDTIFCSSFPTIKNNQTLITETTKDLIFQDKSHYVKGSDDLKLFINQTQRLYIDMLMTQELIDELGILQYVWKETIPWFEGDKKTGYVTKQTDFKGREYFKFHPSMIQILKRQRMVFHPRSVKHHVDHISEFYKEIFYIPYAKNNKNGIKPLSSTRKLKQRLLTKDQELDNTLSFDQIDYILNYALYVMSIDTFLSQRNCNDAGEFNSHRHVHDDWRIMADNCHCIVYCMKDGMFIFFNLPPNLVIQHIQLCD